MNNPQDFQSVVRPGDVLAGKYRVERVLGAGGMGVVVAAQHLQLDQKVAIKFLLPQMLSNSEAVGRFAREAKAAVKITSEHVARVIDVGTLETGAPFMVMEYLDGVDLAAWLRQQGPLPIEQAVEFVLHACVAVAEAHSLGIVHRDLKPANLFCIRRPDGQLSIKVLDFGISKLTDLTGGSDGMAMTRTTTIMGSPLYMSPEQMHSTKSADAQSDIWALGVILYQLLAGRVPFEGEAVTEIAVKVATQPPPALRGFRADIPPALETVIFTCLEKDRRQRFHNVAELAFALAAFAPARARGSIERIQGIIQTAGLNVSPLLAMPGTMPGQGAVVWPGTIPPVGQTTPGVAGSSRRTGMVVALALAGVLVVGVAGAVFGTRWVRSHRAVAASETATSLPAASPLPPPPDSTASLAPGPAEPALPIASVTVETPPESSALAPAASHPLPHAAGQSPAPWAAGHAATGAAPVKPAKAPGVAPGCDPPFTLDDEGRKHFKPECFLNK